MDCRDVEDRLSAYLDGELPVELKSRVAAHLAGCEACQRELAALARLEAALGRLQAPVPPALAEAVLTRLARHRRPWWRSLALAASLVLGIVLGGTLTRDFYPLGADRGQAGEVLALEAFQDFPQGSWGALLVSYQADEGNGA
jgi:anti-sigma factor (TIGR02949 family)